MSQFFQYIHLVRSPYFYQEVFDLYQPTHLVSTNAERYLSGVPIDAGVPLAVLMAGLSGKPSNPTPGHHEALNAALQPKSPLTKLIFDKLAGAA
jgi:hypothetical protein